jgi:class 3 adenylate cyclase
MAQQPKTQTMILALTGVWGATKACEARGDAAWFRVLAEYYTMVAMAIHPAEGKFVKGMGDGTLLLFPEEKARDAVAVLKALYQDANVLWHAFDPSCQFHLKIGRGTVVAGMLGAPGEERFDVVGNALNQLFKKLMHDKGEDIYISPDVAALTK